jgi:hypothetical protein
MGSPLLTRDLSEGGRAGGRGHMESPLLRKWRLLGLQEWSRYEGGGKGGGAEGLSDFALLVMTLCVRTASRHVCPWCARGVPVVCPWCARGVPVDA